MNMDMNIDDIAMDMEINGITKIKHLKKELLCLFKEAGS